MTEEIMIDNVDVSECEYAEPSYTTPKCAINDWIHCDGHDCHYKQLKRKEQVLEILKVSYKTLVAEQAEIKQYLGICSKTIMERLEELQEFYDEDKIKSFNYKQALQKIKEIAEDDCKTCTVKLLGEDEITCKRCYKTKILQKCKEVLKDERNM